MTFLAGDLGGGQHPVAEPALQVVEVELLVDDLSVLADRGRDVHDPQHLGDAERIRPVAVVGRHGNGFSGSACFRLADPGDIVIATPSRRFADMSRPASGTGN